MNPVYRCVQKDTVCDVIEKEEVVVASTPD
jgi:hypothetical protein